MLDSLFPPNTAERRAAEYILEQASHGRTASVREVRKAARTHLDTVKAVREKLIAAGLLGENKR